MKSRELMSCDSTAFIRQRRGMKPKQLVRHIEWVLASLGEPDTKVLLDEVVAALQTLDPRTGKGTR